MQQPKYPEVIVPLDVGDGNIFAIVGRARGELRRNGVPATEIDALCNQVSSATSYDDAIRIVCEWVTAY